MIHDYIARDSRRYAQSVTQEIVEKVEGLPELPHLGRVVPEIGEDTVREISLYSYRIMYEVMEDAIHVHGVIHKRRLFKPEDMER